MRVRWKWVGLAGVAGVAATGAVLVRQRRGQREYEPDELRERLHRRLADVSTGGAPTAVPGGGSSPPAEG
jgi:hypothetical protein